MPGTKKMKKKIQKEKKNAGNFFFYDKKQIE